MHRRPVVAHGELGWILRVLFLLKSPLFPNFDSKDWILGLRGLKF